VVEQLLGKAVWLLLAGNLFFIRGLIKTVDGYDRNIRQLQIDVAVLQTAIKNLEWIFKKKGL